MIADSSFPTFSPSVVSFYSYVYVILTLLLVSPPPPFFVMSLILLPPFLLFLYVTPACFASGLLHFTLLSCLFFSLSIVQWIGSGSFFLKKMIKNRKRSWSPLNPANLRHP